LVIAPHPFYYTRDCLKNDLIKNIDCFDAIEFSSFYHRFFNPNKKALKIAKYFKKPLVGSSDTHYAFQFGITYSLIEIDNFTLKNIIKSIKENKISINTKSLTTKEFFRLLRSDLVLRMLKLRLYLR
jgi:hypothetical protein